MTDIKQILERAKQLILSSPSSGKNKINKTLREEYGVGLRDTTILKLKSDTASEHPELLSELYARGGIPLNLMDTYKGWRSAGFMPFEARELTIGHGKRFNAFDSKAIFDSEAGKSARAFRTRIIKENRDAGMSWRQIRDSILDFYLRSRKASPWEHIRAEYKPRKKMDFIDYRDKLRIRAKEKQRRLMRGKR